MRKFCSFLVKLITIFFYHIELSVTEIFSLHSSKVHPYLFFIIYFAFMFKALIDLGFILVYICCEEWF